MAYGLTLRNSANQIMFSTENIAYHFVGKYTATGAVPPVNQNSVTFTASGTPIIFIDGGSGNQAVTLLELTNIGGNNWTAKLAGRTLSGSILTSMDVYIFAFPDLPSASGYGMWAKNASGITTLNINQRLLKISGAYRTTAQSSSSSSTIPNQSMTFGSIPNDYIVAAPVLGEIIRPGGGFPVNILFGAGPYRVNASTVGLQETLNYGAFGASPVTSYRIYENQYVMFADKSLYL